MNLYKYLRYLLSAIWFFLAYFCIDDYLRFLSDPAAYAASFPGAAAPYTSFHLTKLALLVWCLLGAVLPMLGGSRRIRRFVLAHLGLSLLYVLYCLFVARLGGMR